jgi:hypothetical protein
VNLGILEISAERVKTFALTANLVRLDARVNRIRDVGLKKPN